MDAMIGFCAGIVCGWALRAILQAVIEIKQNIPTGHTGRTY